MTLTDMYACLWWDFFKLLKLSEPLYSSQMVEAEENITKLFDIYLKLDERVKQLEVGGTYVFELYEKALARIETLEKRSLVPAEEKKKRWIEEVERDAKRIKEEEKAFEQWAEEVRKRKSAALKQEEEEIDWEENSQVDIEGEDLKTYHPSESPFIIRPTPKISQTMRTLFQKK